MFINKTKKNILCILMIIYCLVNISISHYRHREIKNFEIEVKTLQTINTQLDDELTTQKNASSKLKEDLSAVKAYYSGDYKISYYDACISCTGKTNGITASGAKAQEGVTIAADTSKLPLGTKVYIEGIGFRTVQDRGGAIKGNKLDIYINDCNGEMPYNQQNLKVWVIVE